MENLRSSEAADDVAGAVRTRLEIASSEDQ